MAGFDFCFSEEQYMFRDSLRDLLAARVTGEKIRRLWDTETGRDPELWKEFSQMGLFGMLLTEERGGLGLCETDFVLLARECGFAALPEPLCDTVLLIAPAFAALGGKYAEEYLLALCNGELQVGLGAPGSPCLSDASADGLALIADGRDCESTFLLPLAGIALHRVHSVDPSRRLHTLQDAPDWRDKAEVLAEGEASRALWARLRMRGALGCAAQLLGISQRLLDMSVAYTSDRKQFGVPVGSFQAVKHRLANVAVELEFAVPAVWRAAESLAQEHPSAQLHVAQAFCLAAQSALQAVENCVQVHGAMGCTWEMDLHIWMKHAWALEKCWGGQLFHRRKMMEFLQSESDALGARSTFS